MSTTSWTDTELAALAAADELAIAPYRPDGTLRPLTTIWVVRDEDALVVRSFRGGAGGWYRRATRQGRARIRGGGLDRDVVVERAEPDRQGQVDDAYRAKYGASPYVTTMTSPDAAATTLRLIPTSA